MLVSNFVFDLFYFTSLVDIQAGFPVFLAKGTAGLFVLLVGISLTLSYARPDAGRLGFVKYLRRGGRIFAYGLLITVATWFAVGRQLVVFGILHLIGLGIILAYPFLRHRLISLFCGVLIIGISFFTTRIIVSYHWLLWLGLQYDGFSSVDYTPVIPWFGLILIGIFLGRYFNSGGWLNRHTSSMGQWRMARGLAFCGRHSLPIYFVHQPIFWAGFWLITV
jgi:uncharacterized membrane protein